MSEEPKGPSKGTLFGGAVLLGLLGMKLIKALAIFKVGGMMGSLVSMVVSIGLYTALFGWKFALAIIILLYIHEMGHWIWMRAMGLKPKAPMFIPLVGAYVAMRELPPDEAQRAWVAFSGPLIGGIGCAVLYWMGVHTDNTWMMAAGSYGFALNLLQLIPAKPFDGGFVVQAINKWLLVPGVFILIGLAFALQSGLLMIISILSVFSVLGQIFHKRGAARQHSGRADAANAEEERPTVPDDSEQVLEPAPLWQKAFIAGAYVSLAGMLGYLYMTTSDSVKALIER